MKNYKHESLKLHKDNKGKIGIFNKISLKTKKDLSLVYTPGVAFPCMEIFKDKKKAYKYTNKGNSVAIITDGSAVLGLGNLGAEASIPVMEGKSVLFKYFGNIDAFPLALNTNNPDEIISIVKAISPNFGGINLEDISSPNCFYIEDELKKNCDIPVFHDDQHGTAIVTLAGLINASRLLNKKLNNLIITINGAGAAGIAIAKLLLYVGVKDIFLCDKNGIINKRRNDKMNFFKKEISTVTNFENRKGSLKDAIAGSDVFIGVSSGELVSESMISSMNKNAIVFAMANPIPEIMPELAIRAGARIVGTGRSDFNNQINNILAFPGIFRGILDSGIKNINKDIEIAAAEAISSSITKREINENYIIPSPLDKKVAIRVAKFVYKAAIKSKNRFIKRKDDLLVYK